MSGSAVFGRMASIKRLNVAPRTLPPVTNFSGSLRPFSSSFKTLDAVPAPDPSYDPREKDIHIKLANAFEPAKLRVEDISGGCGAQYAIDISSKKFNGLTQLKQHRLVNEVLKEELKQWHAIRLTTSAVKE